MSSQKKSGFLGLLKHEVKRIIKTPLPLLMLGIVFLLSILTPAFYSKVIVPTTVSSEIYQEVNDENGNEPLTTQESKKILIRDSFEPLLNFENNTHEHSTNFKLIKSIAEYNSENQLEPGSLDKMSGLTYFNFFSGNISPLLILLFTLATVLTQTKIKSNSNYRSFSTKKLVAASFLTNATIILTTLLIPMLLFTLIYSMIYGVGPGEIKGLFNPKLINGFPPDYLFGSDNYTFYYVLPAFKFQGSINLFQGSMLMLLYQVLQIFVTTAFVMVIRKIFKEPLKVLVITVGIYFLATQLQGIQTLKLPMDYIFLSYTNAFRDTFYLPDSHNSFLIGSDFKLMRDYFLGIGVMIITTIALLYSLTQKLTIFDSKEV